MVEIIFEENLRIMYSKHSSVLIFQKIFSKPDPQTFQLDEIDARASRSSC